MDRVRSVRRRLALMVAVGVAGSLTALPAIADDTRGADPTGTVAGEAGGSAGSKLDWGACPKDVLTGTKTLECTTVPVPLDYSDPDGSTITIMISRLASQNPAERRGALLLNPGGPGGAGLSQPADLATLGLPQSVLDSYDLIGMDPRGVGHSSPISCGFTTEQNWTGNLPPYAGDAAAVAEQAAVAKSVADQCAAHDTDHTMRHITTANTARDMDRIRVALGEQKLSYFGVSYGSALGSAYASMFSDHADRVVIDSNLGSTSMDRGGMRRFGLGAEQRFPDFAAYAAERHASYGLGRTPAAVRKNYFALAKKLDRAPVGGIDGAMFRATVFAGLYGDAKFAETAQTWQLLAESDDAAVKKRFADRSGPSLPGTPPTAADRARSKATGLSPYDNGWSVFLAATCNDTAWPRDIATYQREVANDRDQYPLFGAAAANIMPCAYWHDEPSDPVQVDDDGPANVLIVQNLRDPATPLLGGKMARTAFGDRARLVSIDQGGHGAYVYNDNPCGLNVTTRFLLTGKLPAHDVSCAASTTSGLTLDATAKQQRTEVLDRLGR